MERGLLVVDDEEAIGFALKRYFGRNGLRVDVATDADEARAFLAGAEYAVVLADLRLKGTHDAAGLDLLQHIQQTQPAVRCILLSAYANPEMERLAIERGARLVLRKPIALPDLLQHVRGVLEQ
jgi:DNA-binding NtrC family response regulator